MSGGRPHIGVLPKPDPAAGSGLGSSESRHPERRSHRDRAEPWLLESFFQVLERHYSDLPRGEHYALGVKERLRCEHLLCVFRSDSGADSGGTWALIPE